MNKLMIITLLLALFAFPTQSFALSCAEPPSLKEAFDQYDGVILGKVLSVKEGNKTKELVVEVDKSFKGVQQKYISVKEDADWGTSQVNFSYLFFLSDEAGQWKHPLCSPTTNNIVIASQELGDIEAVQLTINENPISSGEEKRNVYLTIVSIAAFPSLIALFIIVGTRRLRKI